MSRDMAWQNLTVPTAAIGAKPWRERAFKAIRLAEAIVDNSSRGFTMAPWRSSVMYEHQGRRLARMEGCDPVPGSYPEPQESEAQHQARIEQAKYSLKPEEEVGKRCGGSNVLSSSGDVLYKVPEGHSEGWGFRMEMEMLPFLRDMTALNSNEQISIYAYQSRAVLMGLRTSINSINQEIQRLNQHRQQLLQILANVRKAIQLNHQTSKIRDWRPAGERQYLTVSSGETRAAAHRAQRWYHQMDVAQGITLGPEKSTDLTTRERLDRPMVRVFQRHAGNQLPEAATLVKGTGMLKKTLEETNRNIRLLHLARKQLNSNARDKKYGFTVDSGIVRLRKQKMASQAPLEKGDDTVRFG
ncbi:coiled-coil domain-containing protein 105 isoform X1 [Callorhinchus milii]|uniref:coiled-coil domain-containing protein 105 isoform X1 n=1 Tax=Callorhinchus milii TaxID=7868 RepID=UPI001C3F9D7A|nr:coiled-coil domain-containing protein 105 isoform X1 [Callorhinchus milii]